MLDNEMAKTGEKLENRSHACWLGRGLFEHQSIDNSTGDRLTCLYLHVVGKQDEDIRLGTHSI